jgi:hypothetical protein
MNHHHIARFTRSLTRAPSRRDVLRGLAGFGLGVSAFRRQAVAAKHKHHKQRKKKKTRTPPPPATPCTPRCGRKVCGDDGCGGSCGSCGAGQFCASGTCCTPDPVEETCSVNCRAAGCPRRCDTVRLPGTCGLDVACSCPSGQECLSNRTCGQVCSVNTDCPGQSSDCNNCEPSTEGARHCSESTHSCAEQTCMSTAECPLGTQCQAVSGCPGGTQNRCVPLSICTG